MTANGVENVAVGEHHTMSARASVVTMIPIAGPFTPATSGLGKSMNEVRNVSSLFVDSFNAATRSAASS